MAAMQASLPVLPNVKQLTPLVCRILGQNPGPYTLQGTNTYLIGPSSSLLLVDTAQGLPEYLPHLRAALETHNNPVISDILLSHWHHDHVGGLADVLGLLAELKMRAPRVWKFPNKDKDKDVESILMSIPPSTFVPSSPSALLHQLSAGQTFQLGSFSSLEILHTPGHTTDSISLLLESEKIMFTADTVLGHGTAVFEDLGSYMRSLEQCANRAEEVGPELVLFCGHGEVVQGGAAKIREYHSHRKQRENEVLSQLKEHVGTSSEGLNALFITKNIYKDTIPTSLVPAATRGVILHLRKLVADGLVEVAKDDAAAPPDPSLPDWNDRWKLIQKVGGKM
ncbi:Metallo-hydrolase/oxidoreductase [Meredithblackwellia eburnea MCA 4105]